jgi:hypothetical protein
MPEQTHWELVDETESQDSRPRAAGRAGAGPLAATRWLKWKLAGLLIVSTAVLILAASLAGLLVLFLSAVAMVAGGISKAKRYFRHQRGACWSKMPANSA